MKELDIIYLLVTAIVVSKIIIGFLIVYLVKRRRELSREKAKLYQSNVALEAHIAKIEEQQQEIVDSENFKLKILSLASHDLRTPFQELVMLFDYADVSDLSDSEFKKLMQTIRKQLKISKNMLDNVLVWTAGQLKNKEYGKSAIALAEQINLTVDLFATQTAAKQINVINNVPDGVSIIGNAEVFNFVIRNLLSNAIKYSPVASAVEIGADESEVGVRCIYIQDAGQGIDENTLITLRSGQLIQSTLGTDQEKGVGLGLSLCRDLLKRVGWSLEIESEWGKGSRFSLFFVAEKPNHVLQFADRPQTGTLN